MPRFAFPSSLLLGTIGLAACGTSELPNGTTSSTSSSGGITSNTGGVTTGMNGGGSTSLAGSGQGGVNDDTGVGGANSGGDISGSGGTAVGGEAGTVGTAGAAASGGSASVVANITAVVPSAACGVATALDDGTYTFDVAGVKTDCSRSGCGDLPDDGEWTDTREFTLYKPSGYDNATPYTLVFMGPGCGGGSTNIYEYDNSDSIIRVGLSPSQNVLIQSSHGTNQNQGCFDDKEGDDSVDFVFYEALYDMFDTLLCFDKNRVFAGGNSSGAWLANELGCKYAGDPLRPIRGILPNTGGLPSEPQFKPTCTNKGMAGMWVHETGDATASFSGNIYAINRAMEVNGCISGQTYDTAGFADFPIPGIPTNTCRRITGCDSRYPLVVCPLNGNGRGDHSEVVNPGAAAFLQAFSQPPLIAE